MSDNINTYYCPFILYERNSARPLNTDISLFECQCETWVTTQRDTTRLEAAEMSFLRSVTGYTRLDKIRCEVIRKELEISGIQDVRLKHKHNWINHL